MPVIKIRPLAWQDISAIAEYLELHGGLDLAERFLNAITAEFDSLSKMPEMGALCGFENLETRKIRRWPVKTFERWLIFYEPLNSGIEVARGAQDIHAILG